MEVVEELREHLAQRKALLTTRSHVNASLPPAISCIIMLGRPRKAPPPRDPDVRCELRAPSRRPGSTAML